MYKYVCVPHESLGMKGAVVVGDEYPSTGGGGGGGGASRPARPSGATTWLGLFGGTLFAMLVAPLAYSAIHNHRYPDGVPAGGAAERPAVTEAPLADDEQVEELGHDEFDPTGTLSLVLVYMLILVAMWVFMYFVEFLGRVTVIG
jgi:CDP-diglyceride synthetase